MDNRQFNVNGEGDEMLLKTLELVFQQEGNNTKAVGWEITKTHGLILYWFKEKGINLFPTGLDAKSVLAVVVGYLDSDESENIDYDNSWDSDYDHDGHNGKGWRVYCEDWGHVNESDGAFCAIRLAYMWYGK